VKENFESDLRKDPSLDPNSFIIVPVETANVSSTLVRSHLKQISTEAQNHKEVGNLLVQNGYETEEVVNYILQNFDDLYLHLAAK
jgi:hypothetical protein